MLIELICLSVSVYFFSRWFYFFQYLIHFYYHHIHLIMLQYCIHIACGIDIVSAIWQLQYNKQKKSIYGLSFDYVLFSFLHLFLSILTIFLYINNDLQYLIRNPIYNIIPVSFVVLLFEIAQCCVLVLILLQLRVYNSTKNSNQGFSPFGLIFLGSIGFLLLWVIKMYTFQQGKIILLDVIDMLWMISRTLSCVKYLPLISMNWFDESVVGVFPDWWKFQLATCGFQLLGKLSKTHSWWEIPLNYPTWVELLAHLVSLVILIYQLYIYKDNKPTLKERSK